MKMEIKQLYYTSCKAGKSVGGSSGFQIRAISSDIPPDRSRAIISYIGYSLPGDIIPNEKTYLNSQTRMAFLNTPDAGKILCHGVYIGKDPMTGRFGNFFSHVLLNIPDNIFAIDAIQTWGSEFWKKNDTNMETNLDDISFLPQGNISENVFYEFMKNDANKEMFNFLLSATLLVKEEGRIFVCAPANEIALCIFGITQVLPKTAIKGFTYSTYESNPLSCGGKLVGTWLGNSKESELPSSCFRGSNIGYNKITGKKSIVLDNSYFYKKCELHIKSRIGFQKLTKERVECEKLKVESIELFKIYFQLKIAKNEAVNQLLSNDELLKLLSNENVAKYILNPTNKFFLYDIIYPELKINKNFKPDSYLLIGEKILKFKDDIFPNLIEINNNKIIKRIESWYSIALFKEDQIFDETNLKNISAEIKIDNHFYPEIVELAIKSMFQKSENECNIIKLNLEQFIIHFGNIKDYGLFKVFTDFYAPFFKYESNYPNNISVLEAIIKIGLSNYSKENNLTYKFEEYLKKYLTKVKKSTLLELDKKSKHWNKESKSSWLTITNDLIDRRTLMKKIIHRGAKTILFVAVILIFLSIYDEYNSKKYMLVTKFLDESSRVLSFFNNKNKTTESGPPSSNQKKHIDPKK